MKKGIKELLQINQIEDLVKHNFPESEDVQIKLLSAGRFNTLYRIDGIAEHNEGIVLKIGPLKQTPILICERDILKTDFKILERLKKKNLPLPKVIKSDTSKQTIPHDYYFMTLLEGEPTSYKNFTQNKVLKVSLMKYLSVFHEQEGEYFGYVKDYTKFKFKYWTGAFYAMVTDALSDAHNLKCKLPAAAISASIKKNSANLDEIRKPRLVVNNLNEGNVLIKNGEEPIILGIVDFETVLYGDPLMDFATRGFLLNGAETDEELIKAYEEGGLSIAKGARAKIRIQLYQMLSCIYTAIDAKRTGGFNAYFKILKERRKIKKLLKVLLYKPKSLTDDI